MADMECCSLYISSYRKIYHLAVINSFPRHTGKQNEQIRHERDSKMVENRVGKKKTVQSAAFRNIWANTEGIIMWGMSYY
jgi:hypothetical protein